MLIKQNIWLLFCLLLSPLSVHAEKAPNFKLPTLEGRVELSDYTGKIVYLDFWASWCGPCRKSFPWMSDLQNRYQNDLKVIAINLDEDREQALAFLKKYPAGFTVAFDPEEKVAEAYGVPGMPTSYLIGPAGQIVSSHIGFRNSEKNIVESKIQSLLSGKK